jgi:hypothetical protein
LQVVVVDGEVADVVAKLDRLLFRNEEDPIHTAASHSCMTDKENSLHSTLNLGME